jgi:ankyrin repeat protein
VLSRALIDEKLVGGDSALVCYFFFKDNEEQNSTPRAICALLHQLFRSKKSLFSKYAVPAIKENGEQLKTEFEELWRLLMATATDLEGSKIICVLDALDECQQDDRDKLIRKLEEFYKASTGHSRTGPSLKFLVTSRPYRQIELRFFTLMKCVPTIRLAGEEELDAISGEINIVIKAKVQQIGEELGLSETVQSSLEKRLSEISHRTYLWLRLIWDELRNALSKTEKKLLKVIDELPTTVEEAYEMLLQKCAKKEEARKILHIIVAAYRPLTLREMDVVLEIQGQSRSYEQLDLEEEKTRKAQIRNTCGLFVSIVDSKIHLIHQTAKEFLVRKNNEESKAHIWRHSLDLRESHKILSEICITHLFFDEFREHSHFSLNTILREAYPNGRRIREFWERQENLRLVLRGYLAEHAFLDYSATYWVGHFREASIDKGHRLTDLASKLCEINREKPLLWLDVYCVLNCNSPYTCEWQFIYDSPFGLNMSLLWPVKLRWRSKQEKTVNQPSTLYWAARSGLTGVVELLLNNGAKVNTQGGHYGNALQAAAAEGHERVVEQLLDAGANVNAQGGSYCNALEAAAASGHERVVEQLLKACANVNAQGGCYGNALQAAAASGHERVVEQLLKASANVNALGGCDNSALQAAAVGGHDKVVQQLLNAGANVNAQDGHYGNALGGYDKMIEQLLRGNADVNAQGGCYNNALQAAVVGGRDRVVEQPLNAGANVNAQGGSYCNALQAAAASGYERVVEQLLKACANVNAQGGYYGNALQAAAASGHERVVEQLLKASANVNAQGGHYSNALQVAVAGGHDKVVEQLLRANADVNAQGGRYGNALQAAAASGYGKLVEQLLNANANVNAQGGYYGNALQAAAASGCEKVVEQLLRAGANANTQGGYYGNVLQAAAAGGHERGVEQLLKACANVNAQGGHYGNALQTAAASGYERVVEQLLITSANVNAIGEYYGDALQAAAGNGHSKVVELMLEGGARVNAYGSCWNRALQTVVGMGYGKQVFELWILKVVQEERELTKREVPGISAQFERLTRTLYRVYLGGKWYYFQRIPGDQFEAPRIIRL